MTSANSAYRGGAALLTGALAALFCGLWFRERSRVRKLERALTELETALSGPAVGGVLALLELQSRVGGHIALVDFDSATPVVPKRETN